MAQICVFSAFYSLSIVICPSGLTAIPAQIWRVSVRFSFSFCYASTAKIGEKPKMRGSCYHLLRFATALVTNFLYFSYFISYTYLSNFFPVTT